MKINPNISIAGVLLVSVTGLMFVAPVWAQDDVTYEELREIYHDKEESDVKAEGYEIVGECEGGMGVAAVNRDLFYDNVVHVTRPDVILLDKEGGRVIGLAYVIESVLEDPPEVTGVPLKKTQSDRFVPHEHMSLFIYFVGDEADRFETWNPAVKCDEPPIILPTSGEYLGTDKFSLPLLGLGVGLIGAGLIILRRQVQQ